MLCRNEYSPGKGSLYLPDLHSTIRFLSEEIRRNDITSAFERRRRNRDQWATNSFDAPLVQSNLNRTNHVKGTFVRSLDERANDDEHGIVVHEHLP